MEYTNTYLRSSDAAAFIGLSQSTLSKMRIRGDGPRYSKLGPRVVIYEVADLVDWIDQNKRNHTSDQFNG